MKRFIFWIVVTLAYEIGIVGIGSYHLGKRLGESLPIK